VRAALKAAGGRGSDPLRPYAEAADALSVIIGSEMLKIVPGRVSTEARARCTVSQCAAVCAQWVYTQLACSCLCIQVQPRFS
jgi:transaldolase